MKKMVEEKVGMVRLGDAVLPCDTTPNTSKTFDTPLIANLGETVFYLNPEFKFLDNDEEAVRASSDNIIRGTVCKIDCATGCATCLKIKADDSGEEHGAVQELFFHSFEEAAEVAIKVNQYTEAHSSWRGAWYEIYKRLFQPVYRYTLKFPLVPMQTQKVWKRGGWHYIIPNRVIADIEEEETHIQYQGKDTKPEYIYGRQIVGTFKPNYSTKYEIVPVDESN